MFRRFLKGRRAYLWLLLQLGQGNSGYFPVFNDNASLFKVDGMSNTDKLQMEVREDS